MLNALNQSMCIAMYAQMMEWAQAPNIKAVIIRGAGDKAFCAGGDIRSLYELRDKPIPEKPFFWYEYRLNRCIFHFPKPYIALLDGITMGGGVGLSVNGAFRVATEKVKLAMPETGIGFFPDVGGSYFLPRSVGKTGCYLGLTGKAVGIADACYTGLVNAYVPSEKLPSLLDALRDAEWTDTKENAKGPGSSIKGASDAHDTAREVISTFTATPPPADLERHRVMIDTCFGQETLEELAQQLNREQDPWARETTELLLTRSPTSVKVVFEQLKRGAHMGFDDCMRMEYRMALQFLRTPDFYEGVRAAVIDKDRNPHWQPKLLITVSEKDVAAFFAPSQQRELAFENGVLE